MPTWNTRLPRRGTVNAFELKRCQPTGPTKGIITCNNLLCCDTHYFGGRTIPCERIVNEHGKTIDDSRCLACRARQPWRPHAYVSVFNPKLHEHFIFECTDAAAQPLEEYFNANGSLRGCLMNAYRASTRPNGKVTIITSAYDLRNQHLPEPPNIIAALCTLWRLPQTAVNTQVENNGRITTNRDGDVLHEFHLPPDNEGDPAMFQQRREAVLTELASNGNGQQHAKRTKHS